MAIDRNGDRHCAWCGDPMSAMHGAAECCSIKCAQAYATDIGRQRRWRRYAPAATGGTCTRCKCPKEDARFCNCQSCRAYYSKRHRDKSGVAAPGELPPATRAWMGDGA